LVTNGPGSTLLEQEKRKAQHSLSFAERQIWAIREVKTKPKRNIKRKLSILHRKNEN